MAAYGRVAKVGVIWDYCRVGLNELIAIPTTIVMARLLSPEEFGITAAATFFVHLAARMMNFGFNTALVQIKDLRPEHGSSVFVVNLGLGVVLWAALAASAPWLGAFFRSPETSRVVPIAALGFVIASLGTVSNALMNRDMRFHLFTISDWVRTITLSVIGVVLAWRGFSFWSLVYAELAATTAQTAVLMYLVGWRPSVRFSLAAIRDVFSFGMGLHTKRLLDYASLNLDKLVVGRALGMSALGFYDKAFTLMNRVIGRLNLGGASVSFRIFAIIQDEPDRFRRAYRKVIMSVTLINYPVLAAAIVVAPELCVTLFGERWLPAALPFQILCGAGMLKLLNQYASAATQARGWIWSEVWRQGIYAALIVGGVAAFSRWGLPGAALAVFGATAIMTALMQSMLRRAAGLSWGDVLEPQAPALVCSAGMISALLAAGVALRAYAPQPEAWQLLAVRGAVGGVFYVTFLLFSRFDEVRALLHETVVEFVPALGRASKSPPPQGASRLNEVRP